MEQEIRNGAYLKYKADHLGVLATEDSVRFEEATVGAGDSGQYLYPMAEGQIRENDWHMTRTLIDGNVYYVPVHSSQFEITT